MLYCPGCNVHFRSVKKTGVCPRCGVQVTEAVPRFLADTLVLREGADAAGQEPDPAETPERDELLGSVMASYRCDSLLGRGGMGRVYLAYHTALHRKCALKILSPRTAEIDSDYLDRFHNEGRSTAALVHPNIVTIHAIGDADGRHFLEMEFVSGCSLQQLLELEGRLTPVRATALALQIAHGLAMAHRHQIVHCDLKSDNVLPTHQGIPKLADFGLAKQVLLGQEHTQQSLVGTPTFMAPELFAGQPATPASDVYALGVCYFHMLTGRYPFVAGSLSGLMNAVAHEPLPAVREMFPDIPLEMAEVLGLLMARSPDNRPPDGTAAVQLLQAVLGEIRDIHSLLREAFGDSDNVSWTREGSRYRLSLTMPEGRRQTLLIEPSDGPNRERLLLIYSVCCKARADWFEEALRLNSEIAYGGISIREVDGTDHFVIVDAYPRATVDVEEIRQSVLEMGYRADAIESLLTDDDIH